MSNVYMYRRQTINRTHGVPPPGSLTPESHPSATHEDSCPGFGSYSSIRFIIPQSLLHFSLPVAEGQHMNPIHFRDTTNRKTLDQVFSDFFPESCVFCGESTDHLIAIFDYDGGIVPVDTYIPSAERHQIKYAAVCEDCEPECRFKEIQQPSHNGETDLATIERWE